MIETLVAVDLPPGFKNNGTTYQSKNRWLTGNFIRFFQKRIMPIGGWVARSLSGGISGTPNAAFSWTTNTGASWLAVGTTTGLYVVSSSNVVSNITPSAGFETGGNPVYWQLALFGSYLMAVYNGTGTNASGYVNCYYWAGDVSVAAQQVQALALDAPTSFYGVVVTPERFLLLLRGEDIAVLGGTSPSRQFRASRAGATAADMVD